MSVLPDSPPGAAVSAESALEEALRIAQVFQRMRVSHSGRATWISHAWDDGSSQRALCPMNLFLYDGLCGPVLFLAALERVTGGAGFRDLLTNLVRQIASELNSEAVPVLGLGAARGFPSIFYTLTRVADWLDDGSILHEATRLAGYVSKEVIANDRTYDVVQGSAGCLVALLALYRTKPDATFALDLAVECGRHLLKGRAVSKKGMRAWRTISQYIQTGFAHGAAGIAYALGSLYGACGEHEFREAALEACEFENSLPMTSMGRWPDYEADGQTVRVLFQWCHGAPGIGLGRLGMLRWIDDAGLKNDARLAAAQTAISCPAELDHACCGNAGRVELLLEAGLQENEFYEGRARQLAGFILDRARTHGSYGFGIGSDDENLGFHQGLAGIGFQWLRLADATTLQSALLWL